MALTNNGNFRIRTLGFSHEFSPASLKVNYESLASEDSGRTADGVMHVNYILERIRTLDISMPPMSAAEAARLLTMVQGKVYEITYFDPLANSEKTIECYTSKSSGNCYSGIIRNGLYTGISFTAIETGGEKDAA